MEQVKPVGAVSVKGVHVFASLAMGLALFAAAGAAFGTALWDKPALIVLGSVVVLAMMQTLATAFAQGAGRMLIARITLRMGFVSVAYFALQIAVLWLLEGSVARQRLIRVWWRAASWRSLRQLRRLTSCRGGSTSIRRAGSTHSMSMRRTVSTPMPSSTASRARFDQRSRETLTLAHSTTKETSP